MVLVKSNRKGGVCGKDELGVTLSPVPMRDEKILCEDENNVSLYAGDVDGCRYGSLVQSHFLESGRGKMMGGPKGVG